MIGRRAASASAPVEEKNTACGKAKQAKAVREVIRDGWMEEQWFQPHIFDVIQITSFDWDPLPSCPSTIAMPSCALTYRVHKPRRRRNEERGLCTRSSLNFTRKCSGPNRHSCRSMNTGYGESTIIFFFGVVGPLRRTFGITYENPLNSPKVVVQQTRVTVTLLPTFN